MHTTANVIGMGTFALLLHPDQLAALRDDPAPVEGAVDELLRRTGIGPAAVRAALEDVEIGDQLIKAGETVTISLDAANRDPRSSPTRTPWTCVATRQAISPSSTASIGQIGGRRPWKKEKP
jgi:cytochrome P450